MRAGRPEDLAELSAVMREEVLAGQRDCVPAGGYRNRVLRELDWPARSRVLEREGRLLAAVIAHDRPLAAGYLVRLDTAARDEAARLRLVEWGLGLARAVGAVTAQVWRPPGGAAGLEALGMRPVRPFWRMDRGDLEAIPECALPAGYRLAEATDGGLSAEALTETYNRSFADHWRHSPKESSRIAARLKEEPPGLSLLVVAPDGRPAATTWCALESHEPDVRAQPVGIVGIVGTVPEHRRRGLAHSLVAEGLRRLRAHGARSASLYVDGRSPTRAYDVYRGLGFEVAFEMEVFEAPTSNVIS